MVDLEEVVLPGNARLLYHDNECYDWGTLGWIMSAGMVDVEDYKYFIMINSSVRGPYAPPYLPVGSSCTLLSCARLCNTDCVQLVLKRLACGLQEPAQHLQTVSIQRHPQWSAGRSRRQSNMAGQWCLTGSVIVVQAKGGLRNYVGLQRETPAWHKRLTSQFDNDTRLVGPVVSCEGTPYLGDPNGEWRTVPHVQSHAIAVDQVSLTSASLASHRVVLDTGWLPWHAVLLIRC